MEKRQCETKDLNQLVVDEDDPVKFLELCKQEWKQNHQPIEKKKGRPSKKDLVFTACDKAVNEGKLYPPFTQGKVIRKIHDDVSFICEDTINGHVKTWITEQIHNLSLFSIKHLSVVQMNYIEKNMPKVFDFVKSMKKDTTDEEIMALSEEVSTFCKRLNNLRQRSPERWEAVLKRFHEYLNALPERWREDLRTSIERDL